MYENYCNKFCCSIYIYALSNLNSLKKERKKKYVSNYYLIQEITRAPNHNAKDILHAQCESTCHKQLRKYYFMSILTNNQLSDLFVDA